MRQQLRLLVSLVIISLLASPPSALPQTATSGTVLGRVTDPGGAVVPGAEVVLENTATQREWTQPSNEVGQFSFPNVTPGTYLVTVKKEGFKALTIPGLTVEVAKSYSLDAKLQVGSISEIVQVTSSDAAVELQTTDAQIGTVVGGATLNHLPTLQRDANELLTLQPGVTPYDSICNCGEGLYGGTVTGARSDQNTIMLDGIDISDNVLAGGPNGAPVIPIGVESIEEYRVGVAAANANFGRSEGGQVAVISKSGTNRFHGNAYWYHQNSVLNANSWTNDHNGIAKPSTHDNRAGFSLGGPIRRDKTFVYGNYEVRRFPQSFDVLRIVPTDTLKSGVLTFNGVPYDLRTSTACGAGGNSSCDPRGLGISQTVQALWNQMPEPNDLSSGDGVNTAGFRSTSSSPLKDDKVSFRLDHGLTRNLHFFGRYNSSRDLQLNDSQLDIRGGRALSTIHNDNRGDGAAGGLDWLPTPNVNSAFRFGWTRLRTAFAAENPSDVASQLNLPGTRTSAGLVAVAPGAPGFLDVPIDVDSSRAASQFTIASSKQLVDDLNWTKGKHTIGAGVDIRWLPTTFVRTDKILNSLTSPVATLDADVGDAPSIPADDRPLGLSADQQLHWDRLYAAAIGLVSSLNVLGVRDGKLNPLPLGTPLAAVGTARAYDFYAQDTWRIMPSLTVTYGLSYGWQTAAHEKEGRQTFLIDASTGVPFTADAYINAKAAAARNGQTYNPPIGYLPIRNSGRSNISSIDYGDWAPHIAFAWSPSLTKGIPGRIFGDRRTAVRGGAGIAYDRVNSVSTVILPMLGIGFAETASVRRPECGFAGTPGAGCSSGSVNPSLSGFRVGVDGDLPLPTLGPAESPIVPSNPFSEVLSFQGDPKGVVGRSYLIDFGIQRQITSKTLFEVSYVGRLGRQLPASVNFNSSPYFFKDAASGQTLAQAFDAVATQLRANSNAPVTSQPWFENQLPQLGPAVCGSAISSTQCLANTDSTNFQVGALSSLFLDMDIDRGLVLGLPTYNNLNVLDLFMRTHGDISNYHSALFTLHQRASYGLTFDINYTFSKSLDQVGNGQNSASYYASSFDRHLEYGPSFFDRTHIFNAVFNWDLPVGGGHFIVSSHNWVNKVIGGWYTAGILRASSGLPVQAAQSTTGNAFGGGLVFGFPDGEIPLVPLSQLHSGSHRSGSDINFFANPDQAVASFRPILISRDTRTGRSNPMRGFGLWNFDFRVGKATKIAGKEEGVRLEYSADFFNLFNHVNFLDPDKTFPNNMDLTNPATFGVVTDQLVPSGRQSGSPWIQLGLRVEF